MRFLKSIVLTVLVTIVCISCRDGSHADSERTSGIEEPMNFNHIGYDSMRNFYNSDSSFMNILSDKIASGDSNAFRVNKLLALSFEDRTLSGLNDSEINSMVAAFRLSKNVLNKFSDIEKSLSNEDAIRTRMEADSILKRLRDIKLDVSED